MMLLSLSQNRTEIMKTYGQLFRHIDRRLGRHGCDCTFRFAEGFARRHRLDWLGLREDLICAGAGCDCEIVLNAVELLSDDDIIWEEPTDEDYLTEDDS